MGKPAKLSHRNAQGLVGRHFVPTQNWAPANPLAVLASWQNLFLADRWFCKWPRLAQCLHRLAGVTSGKASTTQPQRAVGPVELADPNLERRYVPTIY
jgi:hypothetical protein